MLQIESLLFFLLVLKLLTSAGLEIKPVDLVFFSILNCIPHCTTIAFDMVSDILDQLGLRLNMENWLTV